MMKSKYAKPLTMVRSLENEGMICSSIIDNNGTINTNLDGEGNFGDDNTVNAKSLFIWDGFEEEWPLESSELQCLVENLPYQGAL